MSAVLNPNRIVKKKEGSLFFLGKDEKKRDDAKFMGSMAEWSKAWDSGSHPQGRGFKSLCCHNNSFFFACLLFGYTVVPLSARRRAIDPRARAMRFWLLFF